MIFISAGSSIGNAEEIFKNAEVFLKKKGITVLKKSGILKNPAYGGVAKNEFSNAVWSIEYPYLNWEKLNWVLLPNTRKQKLKAKKLLKILQKCETFQGRIKKKHWDDRTLDLDILTYGDLIHSTKKLTIPHSEIPKRSFVLLPWQEIVDEGFIIPKFGMLKSLIKALKTKS